MKTQAGNPVNFDHLAGSALVRLNDFCPHVVPLSAATIWRRARDGTFPAPVRLSARATAWRVADLRAWLIAQEPVALAAVNTGKGAQ